MEKTKLLGKTNTKPSKKILCSSAAKPGYYRKKVLKAPPSRANTKKKGSGSIQPPQPSHSETEDDSVCQVCGELEDGDLPAWVGCDNCWRCSTFGVELDKTPRKKREVAL